MDLDNYHYAPNDLLLHVSVPPLYDVSRVAFIGKIDLGFSKDEILGLQSIISGGAMAIFLSGVNETII